MLFRYYDMPVCGFWERVLKGNRVETKMTFALNDKERLTATRHETTVEIKGQTWSANQCKVITLTVTPDAKDYSNHGFCRCKVECWDANSKMLAWTWRRRVEYEMEDINDLLNQFFSEDNLADLMLWYGFVPNRTQ